MFRNFTWLSETKPVSAVRGREGWVGHSTSISNIANPIKPPLQEGAMLRVATRLGSPASRGHFKGKWEKS